MNIDLFKNKYIFYKKLFFLNRKKGGSDFRDFRNNEIIGDKDTDNKKIIRNNMEQLEQTIKDNMPLDQPFNIL